MYATHNSATGERGKGIISWLVTPFSRCQDKTLEEQCAAGCRLFDIRAKWYKGEWHCGHGLWTSERTLMDIIAQLAKHEVYVTITIEGNDSDYDRFKEDGTYDKVKDSFKASDCRVVYFAVKKPSWHIIDVYNYMVSNAVKTDYEILDSHNLRRFIPIPRLWARLRHPNPQTELGVYTLVDFL